MAQDGPHPHDHHDTASSDEPSFVPPTTMAFLGSTESAPRTSSPVDMDASKGNDAVPNAIQGGEHGSTSGGKAMEERSTGKQSAGGAGVGSANAAGDGLNKGKSPLAADHVDGKIIMERERRRRMKDMFSTLHALMPHVSNQVDKATLVGEAIDFIKVLEQTKADLEKRKQEQALTQQAAAVASLSLPRTAQGMAAMSDGWGPTLPEQPAAATAAPPPPLPAAAAGQIGFQTWWTPNIVLSVSNNEAIINMCVPRQPNKFTLVLSVLNKHGIDVISASVSADGARSFFTICTRVNQAGGENPPAEDIYKLAVSEIMVWFSS